MGVEVKRSTGGLKPLAAKVPQENVEEGEAKTKLQGKHFKSKKLAPNVNATAKSSNRGPQGLSLGLPAGGVSKLGERHFGDETSSQTAVGARVKTGQGRLLEV